MIAVKNKNINLMEWIKVKECPMPHAISATNCMKDCMKDEIIARWFKANGYLVVAGLGFIYKFRE